MSERGSFVTEYIHCSECLARMRKVLCKDDKFLHGVLIPPYSGHNEPLPIIAGKIGGHYAGEELQIMQYELFNADNAPCHDVRVTVLAERGEAVFVVQPSGAVEQRWGNE